MRSFAWQTMKATWTETKALAPFHGAVALYSLVTTLLLWRFGSFADLAHGRYLTQMAPAYLVTMPLICGIGLVVLLMHRTTGWTVRRTIVAEHVTPASAGKVLSGLIATFSFVLFMGTFTTFKCLMPAMRDGFRYDIVQADIDRFLHLGNDPGPLLVGLLPFEALRRMIEWNYSVLWGLCAFLPIFFVATARRLDALRLRYLMTTILTWGLIGSMMAVVFLSAGPAYYGVVTGDADRFAAVTAFLQQGEQGPESASLFQAYLWHHFTQGSAAIGSGISAFPSMHVGLAMMNALFVWDWNKRAGTVAFGYVLLVTFSSVYLGWHYAIDGYVSMVVAWALQRALRRFFRRGSTGAPAPAAARPPAPVPLGASALQLARHPVTAAEIATQLEVTVRSIYRDIVALQAMRVPIEGERGIGYILRPGFTLPPLMLSMEETEAIVLALALLDRTGDMELKRAARQVNRKIAAVVPAPLSQAFSANALHAWGTAAPVPEAVDLSLVRRAIRDEQKLLLDYRDEFARLTERTIRPIALIYYSQTANIVAWCELRHAIRNFRADRVEHCAPVSGAFFRGEGDRLRQAAALLAAMAGDVDAVSEDLDDGERALRLRIHHAFEIDVPGGAVAAEIAVVVVAVQADCSSPMPPFHGLAFGAPAASSASSRCCASVWRGWPSGVENRLTSLPPIITKRMPPRMKSYQGAGIPSRAWTS
eukprot:g20094.t1